MTEELSIDQLIETFRLIDDAEIEVKITTRDNDGLIEIFRSLYKARTRVAELEEANKMALIEAVKAIFYNEKTEFRTTLWNILRILGGEELANELKNNEDAVFDRLCKSDV